MNANMTVADVMRLGFSLRRNKRREWEVVRDGRVRATRADVTYALGVLRLLAVMATEPRVPALCK